jgi:hypothetical protein
LRSAFVATVRYSLRSEANHGTVTIPLFGL